MKPALYQLVMQAYLIDTFKQTWAECLMNGNGSIDNYSCYSLFLS